MAPPTFNTVSNRLRVTFVSDSSVGAQGFSARYRAVTPAESESPMPGHCQGHSGLGTASREGRVPAGTSTSLGVCGCVQRAAPGTSTCVTRGFASSWASCATASTTARTGATRPTAA